MQFATCPLPFVDHESIVLGHGSGGRLSHQLMQKLIWPAFQNEILATRHDGAIIPTGEGRMAFTTDSYVVHPIFFPGGNIGELAINGTVNDLAMCGARPQYLSASLIIEEGLPMGDLWRILCSMRDAACAAGVLLVTGDTKIVDRGKADRIFINTSGMGIVRHGVHIDPKRATPGDVVLLSGPIASHGICIMSVREGLEFESPIESDTAALHSLVDSMLDASPDIHVLRDPTRGGVASALNEIAESANLGVAIDENVIPIRSEVQGACEVLGLDPLYVANEGCLLAIASRDDADNILSAMRNHTLGREAVVIGRVVENDPGMVTMRTRIGGRRIVDMLSGEQLPRIC